MPDCMHLIPKHMKRLASLLLLISAVGYGQSTAPVPAAAPNAGQFSQILGAVDQFSQQANLDLARLRIEKWKTGSEHKQQAQDQAESLMKNLSGALPGMVTAARANPASLAATVKLYRDLNALYEVFGALTEYANSFAPKDEYSALANDQQALDASRRAMGDYLENLASYTDSRVAQLPAAAANATNPSGAKRIIVDDDEPAHPVKKKKSAAKSQTAKKPAQPQNQQSSQAAQNPQ